MDGKGSRVRWRPIVDGCVEEVWRRYKAGEAIVGIAHAMGHCTTTVYKLLRAGGGWRGDCVLYGGGLNPGDGERICGRKKRGQHHQLRKIS